MRNYLVAFFLVVSFSASAQFKHSEFYAVGRFSFGMAMNSYTYQSELEGTSTDIPRTLQIELGSGIIPELGFGFKLVKNIYVESSLSYAKTSDFYTTQGANGPNEQGYSFNRYAIQINGKYFVPINEKFVMEFNGGASLSMPQELIVKMSGYTEIIQYSGSNGLQGGFSGVYLLGDVSLSGGLRYRLERFTIKADQDLPDNFETLNSNFNKISSSGIDVAFSVFYNF